MYNRLQKAADFYKKGDKESAYNLFNEIVRGDPTNANAWYGLALCTDNKEEKIKNLRQVLEINPGYEKAKKALEKLSIEEDYLANSETAQVLESNLDPVKHVESVHKDLIPHENFLQSQSDTENLALKQKMLKNQEGNTLKAGGDEWVYFIIAAIFTVIFISLSSVAKWESACVGPLFIIYAVFIVSLFVAYNKQKHEIEKAIAYRNDFQEVQERYLKVRDQITIPGIAKESTYIKSIGNSPMNLAVTRQKVYIWISEGKICFFPCSPDTVNSISFSSLAVSSIPISQIEYFSQRGEVFRENKISGGGGGGASIGGAVAGGLIAGDTGAIIGSRKKVNDIKSELITHDTRETFLNYYHNNERQSLIFEISAFQIFNDLIPEKEFTIVNAIKSSQIIRNQISTDSQKTVTDQLRELAKLRDEGIITDIEFNEKKKQLLARIV